MKCIARFPIPIGKEIEPSRPSRLSIRVNSDLYDGLPVRRPLKSRIDESQLDAAVGLSPRMKFLVHTFEPRMLDVCVDLCGLNTGVAEHLLHLTQIRTAG